MGADGLPPAPGSYVAIGVKILFGIWLRVHVASPAFQVR